jgi:hypothetical protein
MEINSATTSGIQAFLTASERVQESATQIANSIKDGSISDLINPIVDLKIAEQQAGAAAKIIAAENNQIGTLLDLIV